MESLQQVGSVSGPAIAAQQDKTSTKRWIYLDVCKIVSIFLVVMMHVSAGSWGNAGFQSADWYIIGVFNVLSRFGIPLFFMLTGALLLNEEKEITFRKLFSRYLLRLTTAFLFWSVINMVIYYLQQAPGGFGDFTIYGFIVGVLEGAPYVHYFIFLSMSLYLLIPILRAIAKNLEICRYFIILWLIFAFAVPAIRQIPWIAPSMPQFFHDFFNQTAAAAERISPSLVVNFAGYMLLGHYIHKTQFTRGQAKWYVVIGLCAFAITLALTFVMSNREGTSSEAFMHNFSLMIPFMAAGFMIGAKVFLEKTWFAAPVYNAIRFFSGVTFGIFLVHDVLRQQLVRLGLDALTFTPILSVPILSVGVFVLSACIAYLLKRIPKVGKYIV